MTSLSKPHPSFRVRLSARDKARAKASAARAGVSQAAFVRAAVEEKLTRLAGAGQALLAVETPCPAPRK